MELQFEDRDGICIIRTSASELGADSSEELRKQLLGKLEECPWSALDLSKVGFMDSSALGTVEPSSRYFVPNCVVDEMRLISTLCAAVDYSDRVEEGRAKG